jgi:hypothetical protein
VKVDVWEPSLGRRRTALTGPAKPGYSPPSRGFPQGRAETVLAPGKLLEMLRDRVIHRSQIGRRKLDRVATRRRLDEALRELGRRYRLALEGGHLDAPEELSPAVEEVKALERRLAQQEQEISDLEKEHPSGK